MRVRRWQPQSMCGSLMSSQFDRFWFVGNSETISSRLMRRKSQEDLVRKLHLSNAQDGAWKSQCLRGQARPVFARVDECHSGYLFDREVSDAELGLRDFRVSFFNPQHPLTHIRSVKTAGTALSGGGTTSFPYLSMPSHICDETGSGRCIGHSHRSAPRALPKRRPPVLHGTCARIPQRRDQSA